MISQPTLTEDGLKSALLDRGCCPTDQKTGTGTLWKTKSGLHFSVPNSYDGYYPDWMLRDLEVIVGKIDAWSEIRKTL